MTWQEASGTYWMAVLIMAILGYIKQKALLYHDAAPPAAHLQPQPYAAL